MVAEKSETAEESPVSGHWLKSIVGLLLYIILYYAIFREFKHVVLLILVILIHEAGHFIVMKAYGYRDVRIFFIPLLGAFVSGKSDTVTPGQRAVMILAGPIPGIFIGMLLFCIWLIKPNPLIFEAAALFLLLNAFNLLPVSPLDGGQVLQTLYFNSNLRIQVAFLILSILGIAAIALILPNYFLLLIVLLPAFRLKKAYHQLKLRRFLIAEGVLSDTPFSELSEADLNLIRNKLLKFYQIPQNEAETGDKNDAISGLISTLFPASDRVVSGQSRIYFTLIWLCGIILPLIAVLFYLTVKR